jgi:hypothetical protein
MNEQQSKISNDNNQDDTVESFRCIHCWQSTASLYRMYSPSSIKLVQCTSCHKDVDPYIEREWLLVVMDLILLRPSAYRHVLCNRLAWRHDDDDDDTTIHSNANGSTNPWIKGAMACLVLQSLILLPLDDPRDNNDEREIARHEIWKVMLVSILDSGMLLCGVSGVLYLHYRSLSSKGSSQHHTIVRHASLSIFMPCLFYGAVLLAHIWEPTIRVQSLGIVLVWIFRSMAVHTVSEWLSPLHTVSFMSGSILPLFVGWLFQVVGHCIMGHMVQPSLPCAVGATVVPIPFLTTTGSSASLCLLGC